MNFLVVDYDPFAMESRISIVRDSKSDWVAVSSSLEELAHTVINYAYENDIYEVKTHAPFATSCEIRRLINEYEMNQYSNKKITVEGI